MLLLGLAGIVVPVRGQVNTIAYEGFNYTSGSSLAGQNGGTGWTGAWTNDYTYGTDLQVGYPGLTYSGLTTTGGDATWAFGGNGISEDSRTLAFQDSGVVYVQFLGEFGTSSGYGTPNLRFYDVDGTNVMTTGGIGGNGGPNGAYVSILDGTLNPATNGLSTSSALLSSLNLMVVRIDYQNDNTTMWINPDLSTFNYVDPTNVPSAAYDGLAPAFNDIVLYTRDPGSFDEISVLSLVPEPAVPTLLGMGLFLTWQFCRRRIANR